MTKQTLKKDFPIINPMPTRLFFNNQYIEANQVWLFKPAIGPVRIYIVKEVINVKTVYVFGLAAPLEAIDFYRLHRVKYLSLMPRPIREKIKFEMKKWGLRHLIFDPFNSFLAVIIAIALTIIFFYLTIH
jgi:hypothetical protein